MSKKPTTSGCLTQYPTGRRQLGRQKGILLKAPRWSQTSRRPRSNSYISLFYCLICRVSDPTRCLGNNGIVIVCNLRQQATSRNISLVNTIKSQSSTADGKALFHQASLFSELFRPLQLISLALIDFPRIIPNQYPVDREYFVHNDGKSDPLIPKQRYILTNDLVHQRP
jgi:hypothetical protein